MKAIRLVALNTALDHNMLVPTFRPGMVLRSSANRVFASGKGVNSACAIGSLGEPCYLYCIAGERERRWFERLDREGIKSRVFPIDQTTRTNVTVAAADTGLVCHIQNEGFDLSERPLNQLKEALFADVAAGDVVVFSGSMPKGGHERAIGRMLNDLSSLGCTLVLDTDPTYWQHVDLRLVDWIKPNVEEWSRFSGDAPTAPDDIFASAKGKLPARNMIISLGQAGALLVAGDRQSGLHGQTVLTAPTNASPIGCGDAMVGGIAIALAKGLGNTDVLRFGTSAGYANLFGKGPGRLDQSQFTQALSHFESSTVQAMVLGAR